MADRNWNPSEPTVLGLEWPGMRELAVPLSQDAEYGYTFEANATQTIDTASFLIVEPAVSQYSVSTPLVTVYERGDELAYGTVQTTLCAVNGGALAGAAALVSAATIADAVATPADSAYVSLPNGGADEVRFEFATNGVFVGKRILEVKLRYVATRTTDAGDADLAPAIELIVSDNVPNVGVVGDIPVDGYAAIDSPVRTVSLGECNYAIAGTDVWPWTEPEVALFDGVNMQVRLQSDGIADTAIHYAVLEVVWCEENRVAVGGTMLRMGLDDPTVGRHDVRLRTPAGVDNWAKTLDVWYTVTVTSARSPGPFLSAITDIAALSMKQTQGAAPHVPLIDSFAVFSGHEGRVAPRAISNVLTAADDDSRLCPIIFQTTAPAQAYDSDAFDAVFGAPLYTGAGAPSQEIRQRSGGGAVEYPWSTFYVRRIGEPAGTITISTNGGLATTTLTDADIQGFDVVFDGWRKVVWSWVPNEPVFDNSNTDDPVEFTIGAGSDIANRYEILGLNTLRLGGGVGAGGTYGDDGVLATNYRVGGSARIYSDLVLTMHTAAPVPVDFDSSVVTSAVPGRVSGSPSPCQVSTIDAVLLTWDATTVTADDFAYLEIERKDSIDTTYRSIAQLTDRAAVSFIDVEARIGIASTYRMRVCRNDGICSAYTAEETQTPSEGDTATAIGCGFLMFCSNEDITDGIVVFSESYDTDPTGVFDFVEAGDYTLARHFGRFGTQGFHPTERGGVSFERVLLVNGIDATSNRADHEFDRLRNLAYADLPYVCVKDDLGNRWFATVIVPQGSVRRPGNIELATVRIIESTETPWPAADQV